MRTPSVIISALLFASITFSAPPEVKIVPPADPTAKTLVVIQLESSAKNARFGKNITGLTEKDYRVDSSGRTLYVVFPKGGNYVFTAVGSSMDEIGEDTLILSVKGAGKDDDDKVPPSDDFISKMQAYYNTEPTATRKADVAALKNAYRILSQKVVDANIRTPKHIGELVESVRKEAIDTRLPNMRRGFATDFAQIITGDENRPLTDLDKVNAAKAFARYEEVLGKIKD